MRNGKYQRKTSRRSSGKALAMLLALVLIVGCGIGGTLAWLTSTPDEVTNTFVVGNIGALDVSETKGTTVDGKQQFTVIPGVNIEKDPVVKFTPYAASGNTKNVAAYVFVAINTKGWTFTDNSKFSINKGGDATKPQMTWSVNTTNWTYVATETETDGTTTYVFVKEFADNATETTLNVIANDTITVNAENILADDVTTVAGAAGNIIIKAYAIQQADGGAENDGKFTPVEAWAAAKANSNS